MLRWNETRTSWEVGIATGQPHISVKLASLVKLIKSVRMMVTGDVLSYLRVDIWGSKPRL